MSKYFNKKQFKEKRLTLALNLRGLTPSWQEAAGHTSSTIREQRAVAASFLPCPFIQFKIPVSTLCIHTTPHTSPKRFCQIVGTNQPVRLYQQSNVKRNGHIAMILESISFPCATVCFCLSTKKLQWWVFCEVVWGPNYILSSIWNPVWEAVAQKTHRLIIYLLR